MEAEDADSSEGAEFSGSKPKMRREKRAQEEFKKKDVLTNKLISEKNTPNIRTSQPGLVSNKEQ